MDSNAGANEVSEAGSRALETLTNKVSLDAKRRNERSELECLMTGDRDPSTTPERVCYPTE